MILKRIAQVGHRYVNRFSDESGAIVEFDSTENEYNALALPGAPAPVADGLTWVCSYKTPVFDTEDGKIHEGEYSRMELERENILAFPPGKKLMNAKDSDFVDIKVGDFRDGSVEIESNGDSI